VVLDWSAVPEAFQKSRRVRTAAHRIHDDIRRQLVLRPALVVDHPYAGDAIAVRSRRQLCDVVGGEDRDIGERGYPPTHMRLQERPARHVHRRCVIIDGYLAGAEKFVPAIGQVQL